MELVAPVMPPRCSIAHRLSGHCTQSVLPVSLNDEGLPLRSWFVDWVGGSDPRTSYSKFQRPKHAATEVVFVFLNYNQINYRVGNKSWLSHNKVIYHIVQCILTKVYKYSYWLNKKYLKISIQTSVCSFNNDEAAWMLLILKAISLL